MIEKDVKANIFLFRTLWFIELQGPLQQKLEFSTVWKYIFRIVRWIGFLSMPHCCIKRQSLDIKLSFSGCVIEKDVKAYIFLFRTLWFIELQDPSQFNKSEGSKQKNVRFHVLFNHTAGKITFYVQRLSFYACNNEPSTESLLTVDSKNIIFRPW